MVRKAGRTAVIVHVSALALGAALLIMADARLAGPTGDGGLEESVTRRPVVLRTEMLAPRVDTESIDRVVVRTALREPSASYDLSLLPGDFSRIRSMEPTGPASRRPRGVGVPARMPAIPRLHEETSTGIAGSVSIQPAPTAPAALPTTEVRGQIVNVFETTDLNDNQINTGGSLTIPPDTNGAAGPSHLISVTNVTVRFHEKDGTLTYDRSLQDFFGDFSPQTLTFDPRVIYDQFAQRFVLLTTEFTDVQFNDPSDTATIYLAVSDDADPNGTWYQTEIDVRLTFFNPDLGFTTHHWIDFPCLAVDEEAVYIHAKAVSNFTTGGVTGGFRLFVLDKDLGAGGFYDGGTLSAAMYDPYAGGAGFAITGQPAHIFGSPGEGVGTYLVGYSGLSDGTNEYVQVVRVTDPLGAIGFEPQLANVGDIEVIAGVLPDASQSGTSALIDTNARPALDAVWRNNALWATSHVAGRAGTPEADQVSAHWFKLNAPPTGAVTLADQGNISGEDIAPGTFTFFPSIAVNDRDEAVIGFSASGPSIYPSAYAAVRLPGDPPGASGPSLLVREGVTFYVRTLGGTNRWGDYSGMAVDPVDQCFWVHNQYAKLQGTFINNEGGRWATAFGRLCVFECGNGTPEAPEACDDGNTIDGDACSNVCEVNECGPIDSDGDTLGDGCDPDDDDDGALDPNDCAPLDAEASVNPVEVDALTIESAAGQIVWSGQAGVVYDVATGLLSELRSDMGTASATCLVDDSATPQAVDTQPDPPQGDAYYFMVRSQNACGSSTYGTATSGPPRTPPACP